MDVSWIISTRQLTPTLHPNPLYPIPSPPSPCTSPSPSSPCLLSYSLPSTLSIKSHPSPPPFPSFPLLSMPLSTLYPIFPIPSLHHCLPSPPSLPFPLHSLLQTIIFHPFIPSPPPLRSIPSLSIALSTPNQGWASVLFKRMQRSCVLFRS